MELDEKEGEEAAHDSQQSKQADLQCLVRIGLPELGQQNVTYVLFYAEPDGKQPPQQSTPCCGEESLPVGADSEEGLDNLDRVKD